MNRKGGGRPKLPWHKRRTSVPHGKRGELSRYHPVHTTVRLRPDLLKGLRSKTVYRELRRCFAAAQERFGFRLVHYSVQSSHLHLLCEADDQQSLSKGMQGLLIRVAKALNRLWGRKGRVFRERYYMHVLRTPREVRNALAYVLNNLWHHMRRVIRSRQTVAGLDGYASGLWFDGWTKKPRFALPEGVDPPIVPASTRLLRDGWLKHGRIRPDEVPGLNRTGVAKG